MTIVDQSYSQFHFWEVASSVLPLEFIYGVYLMLNKNKYFGVVYPRQLIRFDVRH